MKFLDSVDLACRAAIAQAEAFGGRPMTEDEKKLFHLGFIAGMQHGITIGNKSVEELRELMK